jgi:hypothetical protein
MCVFVENSDILTGIEAIIDRKIAPINSSLAQTNKALKCVMSIMLDPWEGIKSEITEAVQNATMANLPVISTYYGIPQHHYCMVLGPGTTHCNIICAHIWPRHTYGRGLETFDLNPNDINEPRNFLRLHRTIENAFDHKRLYFDLSENNHIDGQIILKVVILDPALKNVDLTYGGMTVKMSTIDNRDFHHVFTVPIKPYMRLLAVHANQAINKAYMMGWISDDLDYAARRDRALNLARLSLDDNSARAII